MKTIIKEGDDKTDRKEAARKLRYGGKRERGKVVGWSSSKRRDYVKSDGSGLTTYTSTALEIKARIGFDTPFVNNTYGFSPHTSTTKFHFRF